MAVKLATQEAEELRSDVNKLLKHQQQQHLQHCNLNPAERRALTQLKQDNNRVILTADKGVAMVVMDQQDYNNKAHSLLQNTNTYQVLPKDPTPQLKNKLITILKKHPPNRRPQHPKIQTIIPHQCHTTQILWPPQNP